MTQAVIANDATDRYDRRTQRRRTRVDNNPEWQALKARVDRGEWLSPGEAAVVLGISRTKTHRMLSEGQLRYKTKARSKHRIVDPAHVLAILAEADEVHGDPDPPVNPPTTT